LEEFACFQPEGRNIVPQIPAVSGVSKLPSESVNELLSKWRSGDQDALSALMPLVYKELHGVAHHYLRTERPDHTLQTTALVHEAYLRLSDQGPFETENRAHFVAIAARLMRQILVDYARTRGAEKRGADRRVDFDSGLVLPQNSHANLVALDDALKELEGVDEQQCRIVELKYFGGLTNEEIAGLLGISVSTAKREWNVAKAWLSRQIKRSSCEKA
jgi:RNA polymerase sigma factor (TIGR02999 family)